MIEVHVIFYPRFILCLLTLLNLCSSDFLTNPGRSNAGPSWGGTGGGVALTGSQQQTLMQIEERDADFDLQLDEIGEGIQDLAEIAQQQGEEVQHQNVMLDKLNNKMDRVNDRMTKVNVRMKETLEEVGRSSDKIMVDIMCIVLAIGFAAVIYKFMQG
jgi:t-SNARE complex subunit (syntaxin)